MPAPLPAPPASGVNNFTNLGYYSQISAAAIPADPSDPDLTVWVKPPEYNPLNMDLPFGGDPSQFRDPTTAWFSPGGDPSCSSGSTRCTGPGGNDSPPLWYTIVGAQVSLEILANALSPVSYFGISSRLIPRPPPTADHWCLKHQASIQCGYVTCSSVRHACRQGKELCASCICSLDFTCACVLAVGLGVIPSYSCASYAAI